MLLSMTEAAAGMPVSLGLSVPSEQRGEGRGGKSWGLSAGKAGLAARGDACSLWSELFSCRAEGKGKALPVGRAEGCAGDAEH